MRDTVQSSCHPTECIDLNKLETETRMLFLPGFLSGFLFFILLLRCIPVIDQPHAPVGDRDARMSLTFITLKPEPKLLSSPIKKIIPPGNRRFDPERSASDSEQEIRDIAASLPDSGLSSRSVMHSSPTLSDSLSVFPNLADTVSAASPGSGSLSMFEHDFRELQRLYGDTHDKKMKDLYKDFHLGDKGVFRVTPGMSFLVLDLFPLEDKPVEDDRRVYRQDLFGLGIGKGIALGVGPGVIGGNALGLISTGRHLVKTIKWNYEDGKKEKELRKARAAGFSTVSGTELRFLILMWRDGRLDPSRLFRRDREFITAGGPLEARSYKDFLSGMEKRGLVVSLQKNRRLYYRAKCSRDDIVEALTFRFTTASDSTESAAIQRSIDLITRCTDLATGKVIIPDERD